MLQTWEMYWCQLWHHRGCVLDCCLSEKSRDTHFCWNTLNKSLPLKIFKSSRFKITTSRWLKGNGSVVDYLWDKVHANMLHSIEAQLSSQTSDGWRSRLPKQPTFHPWLASLNHYFHGRALALFLLFRVIMQNPLKCSYWVMKAPAVTAQHPTLTKQRFYLTMPQPADGWARAAANLSPPS